MVPFCDKPDVAAKASPILLMFRGGKVTPKPVAIAGVDGGGVLKNGAIGIINHHQRLRIFCGTLTARDVAQILSDINVLSLFSRFVLKGG